MRNKVDFRLGPTPTQLQFVQYVCFLSWVSLHNIALSGDKQTLPISFQEESVFLTVI